MALDRIPGNANLYIGGLFSLRRKEALKEANITHVISALKLPLDNDLFLNFKHHVVEVDDVEDENIIEHFPASNAFIQQGLDGGGGVLVHCAMGKSRSTTLLIAHLLSTNSTHTPSSALALIRQSRPTAEPNSGFMEQLHLYQSTACTPDLDANPIYQRWLYQRTVQASLAAGVAPEVQNLRFGDEGMARPTRNLADEGGTTSESKGDDVSKPIQQYRCRRCRTPLAKSTHLIPHQPHSSPKTPKTTTTNFDKSPASPSNTTPCSHLHINPLSWMRPELELGKLEGRLECPNGRCGQSVGRYAWQGLKCSCGEWVVPGMTLARGRVDEVRERERERDGVGGKGAGKG